MNETNAAQMDSPAETVLVPRPYITLTWDAATEGCLIKSEGWKTFEMQIAVLDMARAALEDQRKLMKMAAMQQQAMQAQQSAAIRGAIGDPRKARMAH